MVMLSFFNSREREKDDWERICQEVDRRFKFVDAWVPKGAALGIIEAVWEGETINAINGVNDRHGVNGVDSVNGVNGVNGVKGVKGVNGVNAVNGINGH